MESIIKKAEKAFSDRNLELAHKLYTEVITDHKASPDVWHDRAICSFHLDNKKAALSDLNKAVELQPDYSYRYSSRAYIRGSMKDIHGAIADYKKAIELDPEDAISYNNLGLLEEQLGYAKEAQDRFKVADELQNMLDENQIEIGSEALPEIEPRNIQKEIDQEQTVKSSLLQEMSKALFSKEGRAEFGSFLKGKLKNNADD